MADTGSWQWVLPLRRLQRGTARAANLGREGCGPAVGGVATVALVLRRWQQLDYMGGATTLHVVRRRCGNMVSWAVLDVALATTGGSDHGG